MPDHEEAVREAREAAVFAACQFGNINKAVETHAMLAARLDLLETAIRAQERAKYAALVEAAQEFNYAPEDVPNQDELGGCVFCGGSPPGKPYGYARKVEHHIPDCSWLNIRLALAALQEGTNE